MEKFRAIAKELGLGIAAVAAALLLASLFRDLFSPASSQVKGLELIDSLTVADSSVTLMKAPSGEVYFQEYRKTGSCPGRK